MPEPGGAETADAEERLFFEVFSDRVASHFALEPAAWEAYYEPLARRVGALRRDHPDDPAADRVASGLEREIDVYRRFGDAWGYVFFVARLAE